MSNLDSEIESLVKDIEQWVRMDVANHINGDKTRNPDITRIEAKQAITALIKQREVEARIDELEDIVEVKDRLNDIYGDDPRNNYGFSENQVRDAARYLRGKHSNRIAELTQPPNKESL